MHGISARIGAWMLAALLALGMPAAAWAEATAQEADAAQAEETAEYYGVIGTRMTVHKRGSEDSPALGMIEAGTVVDVYVKGRTWTRIGFDGQQGYVLT